MLGLRDAVLSGWFNQETDELFSGFPISAEDTVLDVGAATAATFISAPCAALASSSPTSTRKDRQDPRAPGRYPRPANWNAWSATATRCPWLTPRPPGGLHRGHRARRRSAAVPRRAGAGRPARRTLSAQRAASHVGRPAEDFAADEYFRKPNHIRVLGEEQFAALVREAGLEILSHSRYGFYWSLWMLLFWRPRSISAIPTIPPRTLGQDLAGAARLAARSGHQAGPGRRGRQEPGDHRAQARPGVEPPKQFRYSRAEQLPGPPNCSVQLPRGCPEQASGPGAS